MESEDLITHGLSFNTSYLATTALADGNET